LLREITKDVAIGLRDQLREVRHAIRDKRHDRQTSRQNGSAPDIREILGRAASVIDETLTAAESVSRQVLPLPADDGAIRGYRAYFGHEDGERRFRHDFYAAFKVVQRSNSTNPRPFPEARLARVHQAVMNRHGEIVSHLASAAEVELNRGVAAMAAAMLIELLDGERPESFDVAATVCLAAAIATLHPAEVSDRDLIDAAAAAIGARRDRLERAWRSRAPVAELTDVFATLLPLLP